MKIVVDADACPKSVLQTALELGRLYHIPVWTVASFHHQIESDNHIMVGDAPQEADIRVVNLTVPGDVVITGDLGLAAMVLGRGAVAINPAGFEYRADRIWFQLEEREIKARLRRAGGRTKGPSRRTAADDDRFRACLERLLLYRAKKP